MERLMNFTATVTRHIHPKRLVVTPKLWCSSCSRSSVLSPQSPSPFLSMVPPLKSPLFTQQVVKAMQSLYPLELADRAWDNVGLLQENIVASRHALAPPPTPSTVLLTNDLTERVAQEAIVKKASVIVSYHPFIFRGLKSVTLADPQQRILLKLAQNNIAVYSPHTAIDAAPGGMNDWLADMVTDLHGVSVTRSIVQPISGPLPNGLTSAGYGRLIEFSQPVPLREIIQAYASRLGGLSHIMIARPKHNSALFMRNARKLLADLPDDVSNDVSPDDITSVAVCAGSGYDVLKDTSADLIVTGEMTHHSALRLTMLGKTVITVFHSNSERKFLKDVLEPQLENALRKEDETARVIVSIEDEDPFEIWDVNNLPSFLK